MYTPNFTPNRPFPLKPLAAAVLLVCASGIHSAPVIHNSTGKDVAIDASVDKVTTVIQSAERAVANWKSFSIAEGELVRFIQPSANSVILNRVLGEDPSKILGELQANGRVFLINPNGIVFGETSQINVGGLVASTLRLKPSFQSNDEKLEFVAEKGSGDIQNLGTINANDIVLLAPVINNTGTLNATAAVNLIAASEVTANLGGADMAFTVEAGHEKALIDQLGAVLAEGGKIVLLASSSKNGAESVINTAGINRATGIVVQGDTVQLTGAFTVANTNEGLQVNAGKVGQSAALNVAGVSQITADDVTLGNAGNDFTGEVKLSVQRTAELAGQNDLNVSGRASELKVQATKVQLGNLNADGLEIRAIDSIDQTQGSAVQVENTTSLNTKAVNLNNEGNDFKGLVSLSTSGPTRLRDMNNLAVTGDVTDTTLHSDNIEIMGLRVAGELILQANEVDQNSGLPNALSVQGTTRIEGLSENTGNVTLSNAGNDFVGAVQLQNKVNAVLHDKNKITVAGSAGNLVLNAPELELGEVTLGDLTANSVTVNAAKVSQINSERSEKITVEGASIFNASKLDLLNDGNDFKGQVNLTVRDQVNLNGSNRLTVAGMVKNSTLKAKKLALNGLSVAGDIALKAAEISGVQDAALRVTGRSTLQGGEAKLGNAGNRFDDVVNLDLNGAARVHSAENVEVAGKAESVSASSAQKLTVSTLNSKAIELDGKQVHLQNFSTTGDLTLKGGDVTQQGALIVDGITTLGAARVTLIDAGNDFKNTVVLSSAGDVSIHDANNLALQGNTNKLVVKAAGNVGQPAALSIAQTSEVQASDIRLDNASNAFNGAVAVNATQSATVHSNNNLVVGGKADEVNVSARNTLSLSSIKAGTLNAAGNTIQQTTSTDTLLVDRQAKFTAQQVNLPNKFNDFKGGMNLAVTGQANIAHANSLLISGSAQVLNANIGGTLTAGDLNIQRGTLVANAIEMNQLQVLDKARLQAAAVSQTQANQSGGQITIAADELNLALNNDFKGDLVLDNVGSATIHDKNQLVLSGSAKSLNAKAGQITQVNALNVQGGTQLLADSVDLRNSGNDFQGTLDLQVAGKASIRDANNLTVQGNVGELVAQAANTLTLGSLETGALNATANALNQNAAVLVRGNTVLSSNTANLTEMGNAFLGNVLLNGGNNTVHTGGQLSLGGRSAQLDVKADNLTQAAALAVTGPATLSANIVLLANSQNDFQAGVVATAKGKVEIRDLNDLSVSGSMQQLNADASNTLRLQNLQTERIVASANQIELGERIAATESIGLTADSITQNASVKLDGATDIQARSVMLTNSGNDFLGTVSLNSDGLIALADANTLTLGALGGAGNLRLQAQDIAQDQASVIQQRGKVELQANTVTLNRAKNDFSGFVDIKADSASVVDSNALNMAFAGRTLSVEANSLNANNVQATGEVRVVASSAAISSPGDLKLNVEASTGPLALNVAGDTTVKGSQVLFAQSQLDGNLTVDASDISQGGPLAVAGAAQFNAVGGTIALNNPNNQFQNTVGATAVQTDIAAKGNLRLLKLSTRGGQIAAGGQLVLLGNVEQTGGTLTFTASGATSPLSPAEIAMLLPPSLDVFSAKEAVDPITGLGRITLAGPAIHQQAGQILTAEGSMTQFKATGNGSVVLVQNNQMKGDFAALAGSAHGQAYVYNAAQGASLVAVSNETQLRIGAAGVEADLVAIRSRGLSTPGATSTIRARMPYSDTSVGASRSFAGLTLSVPARNSNGQQGRVMPFGESAGAGQPVASGSIRVEIGEVNRAGFGGFLTVLPVEGNSVSPGQVIHLSGPESRGSYAFFYDGARSVNRIPVVYNGSLLTTPRETAALTTAQGAVVLARQEQTRSVVRTENVAGKVINGVVLEVGPGRPATEGSGGVAKPASCDAAGEGLSCNP